MIFIIIESHLFQRYSRSIIHQSLNLKGCKNDFNVASFSRFVQHFNDATETNILMLYRQTTNLESVNQYLKLWFNLILVQLILNFILILNYLTDEGRFILLIL